MAHIRVYFLKDALDTIRANVVDGVTTASTWFQGPGERIVVKRFSADPYVGKTEEELMALGFTYGYTEVEDTSVEPPEVEIFREKLTGN